MQKKHLVLLCDAAVLLTQDVVLLLELLVSVSVLRDEPTENILQPGKKMHGVWLEFCTACFCVR